MAQRLESKADVVKIERLVGHLAIRLGLLDEARVTLQRALKTAQGKNSEAVASLQQALVYDPKYFVARQDLASLYIEVSEFSKAEESAREALAHYKKIGNREGEANSLLILGDVQRVVGNNQSARTQFEAALTIYIELGNEFGRVRARKYLGDFHLTADDLEPALAHYQNAISWSGRTQNKRIVAVSLMNIGSIYNIRGEFTQAIDFYTRALEAAESFPQYRRRRAEVLSNFGGLLMDRGPNREEGLAYAREAIALFEKMGDRGWEAFTRSLVGIYYTDIGRFDLALTDLERSRALANAIGDKPQASISVYLIGRCYFIQNNYGASERMLEEALAVAQRLESKPTSNFGGLLMDRGPNREEGLAYAREAIALFEKMGDRGWEAFTRSLVGIYYTDIGRFDLALTDLERSRALANAIGDKPQASISVYLIGRCYFIQNNYGASERMLEEALAVAQRLESKADVVKIERLVGHLAIRLGLLDEARVTLQRALKTAQEGDFGDLLPDVHLALGELRYETGNQNEAREHFRQTIALSPDDLHSSLLPWPRDLNRRLMLSR